MKSTLCSGYTLLELAIVLMVAGLLLGAGGSAYSLYIKNKAVSTTASNTAFIENALSNYFIQNGRYPLPSRLDAKRTDPDYGLEDVTAAPAVGSCVNGICAEESARIVDVWEPLPCANNGGTCSITAANTKVVFGSAARAADARVGTFSSNVSCSTATPGFAPAPSGTLKCWRAEATYRPLIRRGAVPFRILNKPENIAYDGYNSKIEYVVTDELTRVANYGKDLGGISVVDTQATPRSLTNQPASVHFLVLSRGADRMAAYTNEGVMAFPCTVGKDSENCNTTTSPTATYAVGQVYDSAGADHFDDIVKFSSSVETPFWNIQDAAGTNIRDAGLVQQIAVAGSTAFDNPVVNLGLDAKTNARADSNLLVQSLADETVATDLNLMNPEDIAGNVPKLNCPKPTDLASHKWMVGIVNGEAKCTDKPITRCPSGQVMNGVTSAGDLICTTPPSFCQAKDFSLCATNDLTIGANALGATFTSPVMGDSLVVNYKCKVVGSNTQWAEESRSGSCACTAGAVPATIPCAGNMSPPGSCWTGSITTTTTTTCGVGGTVTSAVDTSACVCTDCPNTYSNGCTAPLLLPTPSYPGWSGNINYSRNWVCSSPTAGSHTPWTFVSHTCACNASTAPQVQNGVSCATTGCNSSGAWSMQGQYGCSAGFTGAGKYVNRIKNFTCPAAAYDTNWTNTANTCTCTAVVESGSVACPIGYSGNITRKRTFDCGTNSFGPWINDLTGNPPYTCSPIQWKPQGSISGSGTTKIGYEGYGACTSVGSIGACWTPSGSGNPYNYYASCVCQ